jgi:hypothetical protein
MHTTREQWLVHLAQLLRPEFTRAGLPLPSNIRFSCGWPGAGSRHARIGECWHVSASADRTFEIFISPALSDPLRVGDVLVHELCHAAAGLEAGHTGAFRRCARALGLTGPMRATVASASLQARLQALQPELGPYPHARLDAADRPTKKESTRLIKVICPECGYTIRVTRKWIAAGLPVCPCGERMAESV